MQFLILNVDTNDWVQIHFSLFTLKLLQTVSQKKKKKKKKNVTYLEHLP